MSLDNELRVAVEHWEALEPVLTPPESEAAYDALVERMDALMDYIGGDEDHPLNGLLHLMGDLVAEYDAIHYDDVPAASGVEVLRHLMREHGLRQSDLPEIGSQGVVSEVLSGKRVLNLRQIRALAARFGVAEGMFL
jgi:HTH-type transcriptional regulator/antitoxin HigA